jgi:hypothetical protein
VLVSFEQLGSSETEALDFGFLMHRTEVFLPEGPSELAFKVKTRDMATVMVNGVHQIPPYSSVEDLKGAGYWAAMLVNEP